MASNPLEIFVYYVMPLVILSIGMPANIFGLIVLRSKKKLKSIGPFFMFRLLFIIDAVFLSGILIYFISKCFELTLYLASDLVCKLFFYYAYASKNLPPLVLVYIALDRFISIKYHSKRFLLKKNTFQYLFIVLCIFFSFLYYIPVFFYYKLTDQSNGTSECYLFGENSINFIHMDMSFLVLIFSLILFFTFLLIHTIFSSRRRVNAQYTQRQNRNQIKDLRLTITSVIFNCFYVFLYLPILFYNYLFPNIQDIVYYSTLYIFFISNTVNFFILFLTNSLFRKQVASFLFKSKPQPQPQPHQRPHHITSGEIQQTSTL